MLQLVLVEFFCFCKLKNCVQVMQFDLLVVHPKQFTVELEGQIKNWKTCFRVFFCFDIFLFGQLRSNKFIEDFNYSKQTVYLTKHRKCTRGMPKTFQSQTWKSMKKIEKLLQITTFVNLKHDFSKCPLFDHIAPV